MQSAKTIRGYQDKIKDKKSEQDLFELLNTLNISTSILHESLAELFWQPLIIKYENSIDNGETDFGEFDILWTKFIDNFKHPLDLDAIQSLVTKEESDLHSFDITVLAATYKKYWLSSVAGVLDKILEGDGESKKEIEQYFSQLLQNIILFKLDSYREIVEKISSYFKVNEKLNKDSIGELSNSCIMVLERMEQNGADGDCSDIDEKLESLFVRDESDVKGAPIEDDAVEKAVVEEDVKEEPLSEEEEVEKIFIDESVDHLEKANVALKLFEENKKRSNIITIENEIHTIKSSALLLNKKAVVEITNSIEDVAELFGQSSIPFPGNLTAGLRNGLTVLGEVLKDNDRAIEEEVEALDSLLDQVVIDETAEVVSEKEHRFDKAASGKDETISENVDDELQEIFKQETEANIISLEDSIKILRENPNDVKALDEFESSIHSIKSAAKMLGFKEIGQLSDSIESVIEDLRTGSINVSEGFSVSLRESIDIVKKLSLGESVNAADLTRISNILNSRKFPVVEAPIKEKSTDRVQQDSNNIADIFLEEAGELMEQLNNDAIQLEKKPDDGPLLNSILRNLHTLKGSSLMSGYDKIGDLCHKLEDYLDEYRPKSSQQKAKMLDPVFDVLDILQDMLKSLSTNGSEDLPGLMARISAIDNRIFQIKDKTISEEAPLASIKPAEKNVQSIVTEDDNVIKVSTTYLDSLVNMSTELVVNRTGLSSHMKKLKRLLDDADLSKRQIRKIENTADELFGSEDTVNGSVSSEKGGEQRDEFSQNLREFTGKINQVIKGLSRLFEDIDRDVSRIDSVSKVLHHDILKARMVPIASLFNRYPKAVHDLARKQDKKINFETTDNNAELDRAMVSALSDPILHILRNAVDHGVESPEERVELGKSEESNISIIARQGKSQVIIDIIDDGRGIDIDKVKEIIVKNELATAEEVGKMGESEVLDYIFHSGFSTKETISNISGRGIGLDVVASQLQKLKGNIRVRTEKNIGTTFSLRVPLTLTISQALLIRSNEQTLALPLFAVKETLEVTKDMIVEEDGKRFVKVRGALLPYVKLDELLNFGQKDDEEVVNRILVITDAGINIALGVAEVVNRQEIVIKTLGSLLQSVDYISGGTILGDGEVCLLLDYSLIVRTVELHTIGRETDSYVLKSERKITRNEEKKGSVVEERASKLKLKKISGRKPKIMIVDDSRSVLNFVSAILDDNQMEPIKSSSGIEALAQMEDEEVDLLITDLEMPKMHGFELVQEIRKNEKFDELPILILTGRDTKADREKAIGYGANEFINKPFKERELLKVMEKFIQIEK